MLSKIKKILPFVIIALVSYAGFSKLKEESLQAGCEIGSSTALIVVFPQLNGTIQLEVISHELCKRKLESLK